MNFSRNIYLLIFLFLFQVISFGQNIQKIDSLQMLIDNLNDPSLKIELLLNIADEFTNSDTDKALDYANEAFQLSLETNNKKGKLYAMLHLAGSYQKLTELLVAIDWAAQAKELAVELKLKKETADANFLIGKILEKSFELEKSLDYVYESLNQYEEIDNKKGIANAFNEIGIIYFNLNNFDKAFEYFNKSYDIIKEINYHEKEAGALNNIANIYFEKNEFEKAIQYYLQALEINKGLSNRYFECINYTNLGSTYFKLGSYKISLEYYNKALNLAKEIKNYEIVTSTLYNIANYHSTINQAEMSKKFALEAFENGQKYKLKSPSYLAASMLHKYFITKNDTAMAYIYALIEHQTKDSLGIEETTQKLTQLELVYKFEKVEQQKLNEKKRAEYTYLLITIILVFVFSISIILLIGRHRSKDRNTKLEKKEIENRLELRNKELAINVMSLIKKNEILTGISKDLIEIKNDAEKTETKEALNKIARKIKNSIESEIWEEFEVRFKQVHGEFYEKLIHEFPELSPSELKLCAFLRLNLSSKDISELTGQSLVSLEKARYRLRRKMNLPNSQTSLITFLSKL